MIITISGTVASGKSVVAERLAKDTNMDFFSVNRGFVKELALRKGMSVREYYEKYADKVDCHLDSWQQDICRFMDGFILESKIGFHWARSSPTKSFNIFLKCDKDVAVDRILSIGHRKVDENMRKKLVGNMSEEESFEVENYRKKYRIDFRHTDNFDLVLDTSRMDVATVYKVLLNRITPLLEKENERFLLLVKKFPNLSEDRNHIYVSTPHTTGRAYYEKTKIDAKPQSRANILRETIEENKRQSNEFFKIASSKYGSYVINPISAGDFINMQQREWLALWRRFIRRYVCKVLMNEGWEYSNGCVEEFYLALKEGVEIFDYNFNPVNRNDGLAKIDDAINEIKEMGGDYKKLEFFHGEINRDIFALLNTDS